MTPAEVANLFVFGFSGHAKHLNGGDMLWDGGDNDLRVRRSVCGYALSLRHPRGARNQAPPAGPLRTGVHGSRFG